MDSGILALCLWLVGVMAIWFAAWMWVCWAWAKDSRGAMTALEGRVEHLEKMQRILLAGDEGRTKWLRENEMRIAGVEALLVSTVGQETQSFCRAMDEIVDRMEAPESAPALTLSAEHVGRFGKKKGAGRG